MRFLLFIMAALCSCASAKDKPGKKDPAEALAAYLEAVKRVESHVDNQGYAVVFGAAGEVKHTGDAVWRTGLALAALPCGAGEKMRGAFQTMVDALHGGLWRHPTQPDEVSLDQALGFYLAAASRVSRCPNEYGFWQDLLRKHRDYMAENLDEINVKSHEKLPFDFDVVRDQVFHMVDLGGEPHPDRKFLLEGEVTAWARAVRTLSTNHEVSKEVHKVACFRVNLGWMSIRALEYGGRKMSDFWRNEFCRATNGLNLVLVDNWCGREGLADFNNNWQPDVYDFAHQRCPGWETPDCEGDSCGGIDLLHGLFEQYEL